MKNLILSGLLLAQTTVLAQVPPLPTPPPPPTNAPITLTLAWDPSPSYAATNLNYRLYANLGSTLAYSTRTNATVVLLLGKDTTSAEFSDMREGRWHFVVTAVNTNIMAESAFSNEVVFERPPAPTGLRSVAIQYTAELPSGWQTTGFFRVKVLPPE